MKSFRLQDHLDEIHAAYPAYRRRPTIGITANYSDGDACLRDRYYRQITDAGGTPVLIPPIADKDVILNTLEQIDGLLLTGGGDYNPQWAGEEPSPKLHGINAERDLPELLITRLAYHRQIPMLGICRGIQTLAMALDGEVDQDISEARASKQECEVIGTPVKHSQDAARNEATHSVTVVPDSILSQLYPQSSTFLVNSFHHQAVRHPGKRFRVTATAPDGVIEAIESSEQKAITGVQWHPEWLGKDGLPLFRWLVEEADCFMRAKQLHQQMLTIDTHVDTPMFFPQDIHFEQRDSRILVDLHKMTEGRQDAVFMVSYLPQPKLGENFADKVDLSTHLPLGGLRGAPSPTDSTDFTDYPLSFSHSHLAQRDPLSPHAYADLIFDKIETIVTANKDYLALARTPDELVTNKRAGKKSIVLGIENGLAIEDDLTRLQHFKNRGVAYITLCHNGDNAICDSARGSHTHHGVSPFGEQVIREMNRLGIMVDLSHGGEQSFYDALDISSKPIVCSHSNCKALCDVPRNLTDDQLRALAAKGGVAHTTLYHGFLRKDGEATILDAIAHLEHAISIMGIDHVGIGTDFDGDGGVPGCADASEVIQFTMQLLRRRYSPEDIEKIWGGNWLRVWQNNL